jgi:dCTP deaminase
MLLSDADLESEIDRGLIKIDPRPLSVEAASIDLHMAWIVEEPEQQKYLEVDPLQPESGWRQLFRKQIHLDGPYKLRPGRYIIGYTYEWIGVPRHLAARVEGKSSLARLGMSVHMTAPHITPGFSGHIALEIFNHSSAVIILTPQQLPVCQILFETLREPCREGYAGRFAAAPNEIFQKAAATRTEYPIESVGGKKAGQT